ncbi:MAG: indole-3-glycerol phosphate synthase TrpC [Gemmatimonadetes bacterium]|nr:indole-3-glycerol phosphate synthase TrpC [Gemmatimonadota bacterium]
MSDSVVDDPVVDDPAVSDPGILERIVAGKAVEVAALRAVRADLSRAADDAPAPRRALQALSRSGNVGVIAEVKRRSPGAGDIDTGLDPVELAAEYEEGGALAISVLTDSRWFGGSLDDLIEVRAGGGVAVLRKDFVIDAVQVVEARAAGADLVLLIVRILDPVLLRDLRAMIHDMGMTALVEAHDEWEVEAALEAGALLLGVNNRDLSVFRTDLAVTERLAKYVPGEVLLVSESGIASAADVARVAAAGADAVLVGEALVRSGDRRGMVAAMAGVPRTGARG